MEGVSDGAVWRAAFPPRPLPHPRHAALQASAHLHPRRGVCLVTAQSSCHELATVMRHLLFESSLFNILDKESADSLLSHHIICVSEQLVTMSLALKRACAMKRTPCPWTCKIVLSMDLAGPTRGRILASLTCSLFADPPCLLAVPGGNAYFLIISIMSEQVRSPLVETGRVCLQMFQAGTSSHAHMRIHAHLRPDAQSQKPEWTTDTLVLVCTIAVSLACG